MFIGEPLFVMHSFCVPGWFWVFLSFIFYQTFTPGSTSSSARASPANTVRGGGSNSRPAASNISLDDITSQLEKASLSMDEAARQTSSSSCSSSSSSVSSTALRRPSSGSSGGGQHRRTGSVGTVCEQEAQSQRSSINSACASASSMDSLDTDKGLTGGEQDEQGSPNSQGQNQTSTEVWCVQGNQKQSTQQR